MSKMNYDSDFCGNLPIHQINQIQPYGVLVITELKSFKIIQASENAMSVFNLPVTTLVGTLLDNYLDGGDRDKLKERADVEVSDPVPIMLKINSRAYLTLVHRKGGMLFCEIDLHTYQNGTPLTFIDVYQRIKITMSVIARATSIAEVCTVAARELKRMSDFDKVMIYKFDEHWNGHVLAEERHPEMESYLGFTFPASDIPRQARELYLKNPYRFIPTRNFQPTRLYPVINPQTQSFVDLSDCNLRSVAAVHLEYLKNMNVEASMSTRIMIEGKLWGLVACHHRTPKYLDYEMQAVFEMLSSIISEKISVLTYAHNYHTQNAMKDHYNNLVEELCRDGNLENTLLHGQTDLLRVFDADGLALSHRGRMVTKGKVPDHEQMRDLMLWLHTKQLKSTFCSDAFAELYDASRAYKEVASGVMAIPMDYLKDEYIVLFRGQVLRTINWGGNPEDRIKLESDNRTYHPRDSFSQWQQLVEGRSAPWLKEEIKTAEDIRSFISEFYN